MKVAMVILEFSPTYGGAQRQLENVAPELLRRGVEVHVITRAVPGQPERETFPGCEIHRLPAPGPKVSASLWWTFAALARLRTLKPDVVHAYSLFSPATIAVMAKHMLGTAAVVKILRGGEGGDVGRLLRKTLGPQRARIMASSIDRFITISDEIDNELATLSIDKSRRRRIVNGVNLDHFQRAKPSEREAIRDELGMTSGPLVVQCGRFVPEKRVDALLAVWPQVLLKHPDAQLALVGSGPCEAQLRSCAGPNVFFLGERSDVARILGAGDAFVLPSAAEGLSNAMLEAMAAELAVVVTRVGGAGDVIEDGVNGRLVSANDDDALATALAEVCLETECRRLGKAARATIEDRYSLTATADELNALYQELSIDARSMHEASEGQR